MLGMSTTILTILIVLGIWTAVWKAIALWKAAGHRQKAWFIIMFILNTASILELIYLGFFQKKK
jgi:hypothetical protein